MREQTSAAIAVERLKALKAAGGLPSVTEYEQLKAMRGEAVPTPARMRARFPPAMMTQSEDAPDAVEAVEAVPEAAEAAPEPAPPASPMDGLPSWLPLRRDEPDTAVAEPVEPLPTDTGSFALIDKATNVFTALFGVYVLLNILGLNPLNG